MTVLFAFASPLHRKSVLSADDFDANNPAHRVDKIVVGFNRFAVGVTGSDLLHKAADSLTHFPVGTVFRGGTSALVAPGSAQAFCAALAPLLPRWARRTVNGLRQAEKMKRLTKSQVRDVLDGGGSIVVLDMVTHELHSAELTMNVAALAQADPRAVELNPRQLPAERVHAFSGEPLDFGPVTNDALEDHRAWANVYIEPFAERANREQRRKVIGGLGASVEVSGATWTFYSSFADYDEWLASHGVGVALT